MATFDDLPKGVFSFKASSNPAETAFPFNLGLCGVHEVCEDTYGDFPSLLGFALSAKHARSGAILHVQQHQLRCEHGLLLNAGLAGVLERAPDLLQVQVRKRADALWSIEEAIKSAAIGLIIAEIETCDFTASRRLVLASSRYGVPVILLMPHAHTGASAAQARWRVKARLSANNRFDPHGLGAPRWQATLERSRQAPHLAGRCFDLEWNDETLSLTVVPGLASHKAAQKASEDIAEPSETGSNIRRFG